MFSGMEQDDNYVDLKNLDLYPEEYQNMAHGDSGGPILRKIFMDDGEVRYVVVGVISVGNNIRNVGLFLHRELEHV